MAQQPDGENRLRTSQSAPVPQPAPPSGRLPASPTQPARPQAPPPRPGLSYYPSAPIAVTPPLPRRLKLARNLWVVSFVAGFTVVVTSFLTRNAHLQRLRSVVDQMAPGGGADAVTTSTAIVFWGSLGAMLLVILLEAAAFGLVMRRHGWARWAMIPLLLGHAVAVWVAAAFLVPYGNSSNYVVLLWGAQLLLAFAGLMLLFLPSSGAWLRSRRQT